MQAFIKGMIAATLLFVVGFSAGGDAGHLTCVFNPQGAVSGDAFWAEGIKQRPWADDTLLMHITRTGKWPGVTPENGMTTPVLIFVNGGENAGIGLPPIGLFSEDARWPKSVIVADEDWLKHIGKQTGSDWVTETVLAHELGHLLHRHVFRGGRAGPQAELEADEFAGYAVCRLTQENKLNVTLSDAQAVFHVIAPERVAPGSTHPARGKRLDAVRRGWVSGGCRG